MNRRSGSLARPWAVMALGLAGIACMAPGCGRDRAGPLTPEERKRMPGVIAFVSERAEHKDVWLVRPTGEETRLTRGPEDAFPATPTPDGASLLVVTARRVGDMSMEELRLVRLDGSGAMSLHEPRGRARNPSFSPDGAWFVAESDLRGFSDLVRTAPEPGAEPVWLATAPEGNFEPSVSPDGKEIAFVSSRDGDPEIYVMSADGANVRRLTAFHQEDWAPRWSPDGQWIAFLSNREGRDRVYVVRPDGTHLRAVSADADTGDERDVAWSPDGKRLAFVGRQRGGVTRIWVASMDGAGAPVALTDGTSRDDQPAWSPDGEHLVFVSERTGDTELFLMRADGSGQTQLTRSPGADWLPRWFESR